MKRTSLLLATAVMLSMSAQAEISQGVVCERPASGVPTYPFNTYHYPAQVSQMLYPAENLASATSGAEKYTLREIAFPVKNYTSIDSRTASSTFKVYMASTSSVALDAPMPKSDFTLVFEGEIPGSQLEDLSRFPFTLTTPFEMNAGESLVITVEAQRVGDEGYYAYFQDPILDTPGNHTWYAQGDELVDFTSMTSKAINVPGLIIGYELPSAGADLSFATVPPETPDTSGKSIYFFNRNVLRNASQNLLPASYFSDFTADIQIHSISLKIDAQEYQYPAFPAKIYLAETDMTEFASRADALPDSEFTLVFDGTYLANKDNNDQNIVFNLDTPFTLTKGKGLVIAAVIDGEEDGVPVYTYGVYDANHVIYAYTNSDTADFTVNNLGTYGRGPYANNVIPCFTLGYTMAEAPAMTDLAAESMRLPENAKADESLTFRVTVANNGTVDIENFKIELLDMAAADAPTVLATSDFEDYLAAGMNATFSFKYTFASAGNYRLAARVVAEGDADNSNDTTPVYDLTVGESVGVEGVTAESLVRFDNNSIQTGAEVASISISDLAGRVCAERKVNGASRFAHNLTAGIYIVNVKTIGGKSVSLKFRVK